jgi:hypothetical protein
MSTARKPAKARADAPDILDAAAVISLVIEERDAGRLKGKISTSYVSDVINGRRTLGPALLKAIGLVRVCGYQRAKR